MSAYWFGDSTGGKAVRNAPMMHLSPSINVQSVLILRFDASSNVLYISFSQTDYEPSAYNGRADSLDWRS